VLLRDEPPRLQQFRLDDHPPRPKPARNPPA
jgi:hypothetical protein